MARARQIKYSFFENDVLGVDSADPLFSLMFAGLWCLADREGRLADRPLKIKGKLFPLRTIADPDAVLQWLADKGFIERYEVDGQRYIQILNFYLHQNPHPNEKASIIPKNLSKTTISRENRDKQPSNRALTSFPSLPSLPSLENGETPAEAAVIVPVERRIWTDGLELLTKNGMTEAHARPLLGRLAKQYTKPTLATAIAVTQAENPADPKAFLIGVLKERSGGNDRLKSSIGKSDHTETPVLCSTCNDVGTVPQKPKDAEFDWQVELVPCPDCLKETLKAA